MTEADFLPKTYSGKIIHKKAGWRAPSNIALVKYWGKREPQLPMNPSISFTLDACATTTALTLEEKKSGERFSYEVIFEGTSSEAFRPKIQAFFERIGAYLPFLSEYHMVIETQNSFPHSSGIASSASGMAALALCLMDFERQLKPEMSDTYFYGKASYLARLGSGSACRSIRDSLVVWGNHKEIEGSSDFYGTAYPYDVHPVFKTYHDTILLVHKGQKQVSSTAGHGLMEGHPFAEQRFSQAGENLTRLQPILKEGNLREFMGIVESEALTLHAMMMTSTPYFLVMKPNTLAIINAIWEFRRETNAHVCFTLDAGANVHLLYPEDEKEGVYGFVKDTLLAYCEEGHHICDRVGLGAKKV
ncbi:MAG: diphosphomevalonate/mevalonate 3,5-bisphosphate decarboxylase family protein [Flavobacteriaceae bacterium]